MVHATVTKEDRLPNISTIWMGYRILLNTLQSEFHTLIEEVILTFRLRLRLLGTSPFINHRTTLSKGMFVHVYKCMLLDVCIIFLS